MTQGEFKPYISALRRYLPVVLVVTVVATLIAYGVASRFKPTYQVHFSYVVSLTQRDVTPDYRFDGFYALQATDLFAATLAGWIKTPEHVVAAYEEAGIVLPSRDAREVVKAVEAVKTGPQLVQVTVKGEKEEDAQDLAKGLQTVIERQVENYHDKGTPAIGFAVVTDTSWTSLQTVPITMIAAGTFVFVFLFLLNAVLLLESVKRLP
jgi:capsular polysaccharide biosynthesis protein